jgi:hypothetical protein
MLSEGPPAVDRHADLQLSSVDVFQENHGAVELATSLDVAAGVNKYNKIMPCILQVLHIGFASGQFKRFSSPYEIFGQHQQYVGFIWQISNTNKDVKKNRPYFA